MTKLYVGIDIAKLSFDAYFVGSQDLCHHTFCNTFDGFGRFDDWAKQHSDTAHLHLIMEATSIYWQALALWAYTHHHTVSVVNPLYIHAYAKSLGIRTKTDKQDARLLARYGRHEHPAAWRPKSCDHAQLSSLISQRHHHKRQLTKECSRLETSSTNTRHFTKSNIAYWRQSIAHIDKEIWHCIDSSPLLCHHAYLLSTIPGIGKKTIPELLAVITDGSQFATAKHLVSYVGLAPRLYESGTSIHKQSAIGHSGKPELRAALFMPAVVVSFGRYPAFTPFVNRLLARGKCKKQIIIAVMRKLLTIAYAVICHNQPYNSDQHNT